MKLFPLFSSIEKITKNADQNFTKYGENLSQQLVSQNLVKILSLDFSPNGAG